MKTKAKIALSIPGADKPERFFSLRLQESLQNEPSEYQKPDKLFAVSDIEGNFKAFSRLLIKNNIIDKYFNWKFRDGHLVIVGDCFDRGEQVTECLWLIYSLEEKARKKGGYVHFILGNHEIMNMNGDWRYVHPKYAISETAVIAPATALYYGNDELWKWLHTKNIMEIIGDILFVHGGIASEFLTLNLTVTDINNKVRPFYHKANDSFSDPLLNMVFNNDTSPFWYRGYYQSSIAIYDIDAILSKFGINKIITGHTIVDRISSFFDGKLINIDTDHASGISEALLIEKGQWYRVNSNGKKEIF